MAVSLGWHMVTGFCIAGVYAAAMLRGRRDRYHRLGFVVPFVTAAVIAPVQVVVGDTLARHLATYQPPKLAAIEGLTRASSHVPLSIGGVFVDGESRYAVRIPNVLSLLVVRPSTVIGFGLLGLSAWFALAWWRRRGVPRAP
jgi:cytochrome d ubiquinol oxidase subunit I